MTVTHERGFITSAIAPVRVIFHFIPSICGSPWIMLLLTPGSQFWFAKNFENKLRHFLTPTIPHFAILFLRKIKQFSKGCFLHIINRNEVEEYIRAIDG
jgi:hypothetical protein